MKYIVLLISCFFAFQSFGAARTFSYNELCLEKAENFAKQAARASVNEDTQGALVKRLDLSSDENGLMLVKYRVTPFYDSEWGPYYDAKDYSVQITFNNSSCVISEPKGV